MIRLLLANLRYRLRDWWRKPAKADVPTWTLRQIQAQPAPASEAGMVMIVIMGFAVVAIALGVGLLLFAAYVSHSISED